MRYHSRGIKRMVFATFRPSSFILNLFYRHFWDIFTFGSSDVGFGPKMATPVATKDGEVAGLAEPWLCFYHALEPLKKQIMKVSDVYIY